MIFRTEITHTMTSYLPLLSHALSPNSYTAKNLNARFVETVLTSQFKKMRQLKYNVS